jgi:hypothetical protein
MYQTDSMYDAAFLHSLGQRIQSTHPEGDLVTFEFNLAPAEAQELLHKPERAACSQYQRSLRQVRRLIDVATSTMGR